MGQIIATLRPSSSTNSENTKKRKRDNSSCSEEDEIIRTSSLPSSSTPRWKHDVFLSFCGKDTRRSFTDHLYFYLKGEGILVFRDDESLERGKCISPELLQAIQASRYAIVIFSANYASSKWCLRELAMIVECEEKKNLTIIPIFYHVDPSDVRKQGGAFKDAFAAHEKDPMVDIEEIDTWRKACTKVGNLAGEHINGERYESTIIQQISRIIFYSYTMLNILIHDNQKIVGINSRVEEMMNLLHMESNDVRFLGIHGMGGVGKTTLAEIIYYRFSCRFEGSSFISCTRERYTTAPDLASLQKRLLSKIMQQEIHIEDHRDGIMLMRNRLRNKKVLIILDDVDCEKLLSALAGDRKWFGPGSRVIITCRDSHLLIRNKVNGICEVQVLQTADALQLFSLSAFDETNPPENYKDLSMNFVHYAGGLPLALTVLGRFLFGRTIDAWKSASDQLEANPKPEIFDVLKISFEGLEESQQNLFLDMACCRSLDLTSEDYFKEIFPAIDFEVLVDKSLLIKPYDKRELKMHDLLEKMGQEIVYRQCPDEPGRRTRLFRAKDVVHVLKNDTGTDAIEMLALNFYDLDQANHRFNINAEAFSMMRKLRFLHFYCSESRINWRGNPLEYMPSNKLQFLYWEGCPSESWPRSFQPKNLVVLNMPGSCFERLWEGLMVLDNLKILDLRDPRNLIETPDLNGAPNLEKIILRSCRSLCEVHSSIGTLKQLKKLIMPNTGIKKLWKGTLVVLDNLKELGLSYCKNLIETPDLSGAPNLEKIHLVNCRSLCEVHPSIGTLKQLQELLMYDTGIKKLWKGTLVVLDNLKYLNLSYCENLIEIPDLSGAPNLEKINLRSCRSLCEVHPSIGTLKQLQELIMPNTGIKKLWKGTLVVLDNLKELDLSFCENLIEIPDLSGAPNLEKIDLASYRNLCEVHPSIGTLKQLQELIMPNTGIKKLWKGTLVVLDNLKELDLSFCENLIEIPDLSGAPNLEKIDLGSCRSLCEVHPSIGTLKQLQELIMPNTGIKKLWKGTLVVLDNLKELDLSFCENLIEIPDLSGAPNLEKIDLASYRNLCEVHPSIGTLKQLQELIMPNTGIKKLWKGTLVVLDNLKELDLSFCENLIEIPDLSGAPNLEKIDLGSCRSLCEVHPSIGTLKQLQELIMYDTGIKKLWKGTLVVLDNLKELDLSFCENLIETPDLSGAPNLEKIDLGSCRSLCEVHPSIGTLKQLQELIMHNTGIKKLWKGTLVILDNLKKLDLSDCENLIETPDLSGAPNLEKIDLGNCRSLCEVHPSMGTLKQLQELIMANTGIKKLWNGTLVVLDNLKKLDLSDCENLIETPDLSGVPNLGEINLGSCRSLCEVHPSMGTLKQLQELIIPDLGIKKLWNGTLVVLPNLKYLSLSGSRKLIETPDLSRASNLEKIDFSNCTSRKVHGNFLNILRDMTSLESLSLPSWEVSIFPSVIYSLSSLKRLRLDGWSRLEKLPDLSMFECLKEFKAYGTAISQIPCINLIPKSIHSFELKGGKRMPRESKDLVMFINDCSLPKQSSYPTNHDIGSPVEYEMEEKFWVKIKSFGNPSSHLLIQRCSLGSRIPEWVHNKSKGSSLKMELDGNTMSVMGIAIFIVCQFHSIPPVNFHGHERVAFPIWLDDDTPKDKLYQFSFALSTDVILNKPIVLWEYFQDNNQELNSLDRRKISIATNLMGFNGQTPCMEVEVKEWDCI